MVSKEKIQVNLSVDESTLKCIDRAANSTLRSRNAFFIFAALKLAKEEENGLSNS